MFTIPTRGISSGNDPYFWLNTNDAENDQTDSTDPVTDFAVNYANTNSNGETYIFYAIHPIITQRNNK